MTTILGIDPGLDGAVVVLRRDASGYTRMYQALTKDLCPDGYIPERMDDAVSAIALEFAPSAAVLERVSARPGEGVVSSFRFGYGVGLWRGILAGRIGNVIEPTPQSWQRVVLRDVPGEGKERSIRRASMVAGLDLTPGRRRRPHDGLADAACMAIYGGER